MLARLLRGMFGRRDARSIEERIADAKRLRQSKRSSEAIDEYRALLDLGVDTAVVHTGIANSLSQLGRASEALPHYRRSAELSPHDPHAASSYLGVLNYDPDAAPEDIFDAHRAWGERLLSSTQRIARRPRANDRVRVGYVSPDFKRHPVTYLFAAALEQRNRSRFESFCYDTNAQRDAVTERLERASDHWCDVTGWSAEALAQRVDADRIDILVDLAGHTTHSGLPAFAMKPAPVQVSWLGYFNTTGLPLVDYFISDPHSSPPGQDRWFVEALVRLPHTRFTYEPPAFAPEVAELPSLAAGRITFGCFNNLSKVNDRVLSLWARVLAAVPRSRLKIIAVGLRDERNREDWQRRFAAHGIGEEALALEAFIPHEHLLAAYREVDIALDPFPFAGGMTSLEALWMGVPVVTLDTPMLAGRQTLCFLRNLGLESFIAADEDAYVAIATEVSRDLRALAALRADLRPRMSGSALMNPEAFMRDLESAFEGMLTRA